MLILVFKLCRFAWACDENWGSPAVDLLKTRERQLIKFLVIFEFLLTRRVELISRLGYS